MGMNDLPAFVDVTKLDGLRAMQFAAGQTEQALDNACTDALGAARWAANPDNLIQGAIGMAAIRQSAGLSAEFAKRKPSQPLPASCQSLAIPPKLEEEGLLCNGLRALERC